MRVKKKPAKKMPSAAARPDLYDDYDCGMQQQVGEEAKRYQLKMFGGLFKKSQGNDE